MPAANTFCRLTDGRELRGLSVAELAEKLNVTRQSIYKYENGTQIPSEEIAESIQRILDLPYSFFIQPRSGPDISSRPIFFRDMKTNVEKNRRMATRWLQILCDQTALFERYIDFPPVHLPNIDLDDYHDLTDEDIDLAAENLRRAWGLGDGPIDNVTRLLENNGFIILRKYMPVDALDACSLVVNGRPYLLINTYRQTCSRDVMNLAHELGHVILHQETAHKEIVSKAEFDLIEAQAWRFARAFLMPPSVFSLEAGYPTMSKFIALKKRWRVSIAGMIMHCHALGIIDDARKQYFFREMSRLQIRKQEPLDDELSVEKSSVLLDAEQLLADHAFSHRKLFELSHLNTADYCELIGAPSDYLSPVSIRPKLRLVET